MDYDVWIGSAEASIHIDWGSTMGWMTTYKKELDEAKRLTLVPKHGVKLPTVTVSLQPNQRWVIVCKVVKQQRGPNAHKPARRIYGIGWQETINGVNVRNVTWVYPTGEIENAPTPSFIEETIAA